jgi:hypothetical protein
MKRKLLIIGMIIISLPSVSQELDSIMDSENNDRTERVFATFKGTRIANGHSVETRENGVLEFLITHRFGPINTGIEDFFGLDEANIRLALEYSLTDELTIGLGRSSYEKTYDSFIKYRALYQKAGVNSFPFSLTLFGSAAVKTLNNIEEDLSFSDKLTYVGQVMMARKFSPSISFQISPTYIHFNRVPSSIDPNDMFALGFGTRINVSKRVAINGEYYYNFNPFESVDTKDSFTLGISIGTGGHIFQILVTNSRPMIEKGFIAETTGDFFDGDIRFGFNISRSFQLKKSNKMLKPSY